MACCRQGPGSPAAVSTRSATGAGVRLGRPGRGRQVLLEDLARGAIAEAAPRGVVEPVGEPAEADGGERLGRALARHLEVSRPSQRVRTKMSLAPLVSPGPKLGASVSKTTI